MNSFLKKVIAQSPDDLQIISAICAESKVKISDIKYLPTTKIFLLSVLRMDKETEKFLEKRERERPEEYKKLSTNFIPPFVYEQNKDYECTVPTLNNELNDMTDEEARNLFNLKKEGSEIFYNPYKSGDNIGTMAATTKVKFDSSVIGTILPSGKKKEIGDYKDINNFLLMKCIEYINS